jgi:hypothetical protein
MDRDADRRTDAYEGEITMPIHRPTAAVSAAAAVLFLLTACSTGGTTAEPAAGGQAKTEQSTVSYAQCMRENGVNIPDPGSSGALTMPDGYDRNDPRTKAAEQTCSQFLPTLSDEERKAADEDILAAVRCMRENGIDIADPIDGEIMIPMADEDALKKAMEVCGKTAGQGTGQ